MEKEGLLAEISRIANENGGVAPGRQKFEKETGIRMSEWYPHIWLRWGDAVKEAGFAKNRLLTAYDDNVLIQHYIDLIRELGHFPLGGEVKRKAREDSNFPSHTVFDRWGAKAAKAQKILEFCSSNSGYEDVIEHCEGVPQTRAEASANHEEVRIGFVYLIKHGTRKEYKIGKTLNPLRREGEIRLELPEKVTPIHTIETDDPSGIENYWHRRFSEKRKEGEWFALSQADVRAFKRWKRI